MRIPTLFPHREVHLLALSTTSGCCASHAGWVQTKSTATCCPLDHWRRRMSAGRRPATHCASFSTAMPYRTHISWKAFRKALWRCVLPLCSQHTKWSPNGSIDPRHRGHPGRVTPTGRMGKPSHHRSSSRYSVSEKSVCNVRLGRARSHPVATGPFWLALLTRSLADPTLSSRWLWASDTFSAHHF